MIFRNSSDFKKLSAMNCGVLHVTAWEAAHYHDHGVSLYLVTSTYGNPSDLFTLRSTAVEIPRNVAIKNIAPVDRSDFYGTVTVIL